MSDEKAASPGNDCPETILRQETPTADVTSDWTPLSGKAPSTPKSLGRLQLIAPIGAGAFGTVWKARDPQLDRLVAVKIPRRGQLDAEEIDKFLREARAAAQLRHPHIVAVHEAGQEGETVYIASDYIEGQPISDWLRDQRPDPRTAVELCVKIARALDYAHEQGIVHRDLKPGNVLLDSAGQPHVLDFGLAKRQTGEATATMEGSILGTPAYMSPEQARGEGHLADRRSDVYSLGVMLFELLTGERPFRGETVMLLVQVISDDPPPVRKLNSRISRDLETIVAKCLEKPPAKRYATAGQLADDLERYLRGQPTLARPIGPLGRTWRWCRRNPVVAGLLSTALSLLVGIAVVFMVAYFREAHLKSLADDKTRQAQAAETQAEQQKKKAEGEAEHARKAEQAATRSEQAATQSEEEAQQSLYYANIALAHQYLQDGDVRLAGQLLARCPVRYRHWEWWYLSDLTRQGVRAILPGSSPESFAFSDDGRWIAVGTSRGELIVWDDDAEKAVVRRRASAKEIRAVAFSPDKGLVATAGVDGVDRVWRLPGGELAYELPEQMTQATGSGIVFSPDGKSLATLSADNHVRIWDAAGGKPQQALSCSTPPRSVAWLSDHELMVGERGGNISRRDIRTGTQTLMLGARGTLHAVSCTPDGSLVAFARQGFWGVRKPDDTKVEWLLGKGGVDALNIILSRDGRTLGVTAWGVGPSIFDVRSGRRLYYFPDSVHGFAMSPDASRLVTGRGGSVHVFPARLQPAARPDPRSAALGRLQGYGNGPSFVSIGDAIYEAVSGTKVFSSGIMVSPSQRFFIHQEQVSVRGGDLCGSGRLWQSSVRSHGRSWPSRLCFSPDGNQFVAIDAKGVIHILDCATGRDIQRIESAGVFVNCVRFTASGDVLAAGGQDGKIHLWTWPSCQPVGNFPAQLANYDFGVRCMAFSADGRYFATGGSRSDQTIHVWHWPTRRQLHVLRGHWAGIESLAFTEDGCRLASGSEDGTIRLWDPLSGQEVLQIDAGTPVHHAAFTPGDARIISVFERRIWGGPSMPARPRQPIDLLPWLRRSPEAHSPGDHIPANAIHIASSNPHTLPIPVAPQGSYLLRARFTRTRGGQSKTIGFLLPAGLGKTMLALDHADRATSGLAQVEGHGVGDPQDLANPTNCPVQLVDGRVHRVEARVELDRDRATIAVQLDDRPIIRWQGPQRALNTVRDWEVPDARMLGLAINDTDVTVELLELTPLDGGTRVLEPLPEKPLPPPDATVAAAPCTIDLLPLIDRERGVFDAALTLDDQGTTIQSHGGKLGRLALPVWPVGNYELSGSFTLAGQVQAVTLLPTAHGRGFVHWLNDTGYSGLGMVDGKSLRDSDNPTRVAPSKVQLGRRQAFRIAVRTDGDQAKVTVELDGQPYIRWKGPESALSLWPGWDIPHQRIFGVGVSKGRLIYHDLKLKMLDGEAWILKPPPASTNSEGKQSPSPSGRGQG